MLFRSQIIKENDTYYAILGAQDKKEKHGHIDVWKSQDLKNWEELGFLDFTKEWKGNSPGKNSLAS